MHISQSNDSTAELHDNGISACMPNTRLSWQYTMNFDSDFKFEDILELYNITGILTKLDRKYPELDFFQYEEQLRLLNIYYLEPANEGKVQFYHQEKIGMTYEAAVLYRQHVAMEYDKALLEHMQRKWKERGRLQNADSTVPVHFS